ncbi:MAG: hypothetical protein ACR2O6_14885, partial [Ilumatobacteraceae bacterium]
GRILAGETRRRGCAGTTKKGYVDMTDKIVGVAMSGGGYRASAWGLGALLALTDCRHPSASGGAGNDVITPVPRMISSVSGGSITNAAFGLKLDIASSDPGAVDARAVGLAHYFAGVPKWWVRGLFAALATLLVSVVLAIWFDDFALDWLIAAAIGSVVAGVIGLGSKDLLFGWWTTWFYVGIAVTGIAAIVYLFAEGQPWWATLGIVLFGVLLLLRPRAVQFAYSRYLKSINDHSAPTLADLGVAGGDPERNVIQVICATELSGANFLYLGTGFAGNDDLGVSDAPSTSVAAAAQASSNLPGAFPARFLRASKLGFTEPARRGQPVKKRGLVAVTDGGVYENMGSQWFVGLDNRIANYRKAGPVGSTVVAGWPLPDIVCVANASGLGGTVKTGSSMIPLLGELLSLLRVKTVLYEQTTSSRRRELVDRFDRHDPAGTLIHIKSTPLSIVFFALGLEHPPPPAPPDPRRVRAEAAKPKIDAVEQAFKADTGRDFRDLARDNAGVATALWPLGVDAMADVIWHAYLQTSINMHILHGTRLRLPPRAEFVGLVEETPRTIADHWA